MDESTQPPSTNIERLQPIASSPHTIPIKLIFIGITVLLIVGSGAFLIGRNMMTNSISSTRSSIPTISPNLINTGVKCISAHDCKDLPCAATGFCPIYTCQKGYCYEDDSPKTNATSTTMNTTELNMTSNAETAKLYGFVFTLPQTWILEEINRKPEPQDRGVKQNGHDCAEYNIHSADNYIRLLIQPVCGYTDGGTLPLPKDAVTIKQQKNGIYARIVEANTYQYVGAGEVDIEDSTGKHKEMYYGLFLPFQTTQNKDISGFISATYTGPDNLKDSYLSIADKIVVAFIK